MAILIPDTPKDCPGSERLVYQRFGRDLDDDWIVLHSLGLVTHESKLWGEIDVVVLSTKGVFAIEVKGGRVSCSNGVWTYARPGGGSFTRREDPWTQAKDAMFAMRGRVLDAEPGYRDLLFGYGVIMPHETFTARGPEIEPAVLLDSREFGRNLGFYIGDLMRHWTDVYRQRHGREPTLPDRAGIRRLKEILRPDVESAFSLGSWLNGLEQELLQLTNEQIRAARGVANNLRTVIRGRAGTGKTVIAIDRARQLAQQGEDVLYLCFNRNLATHVALSLADDPAASRIRVHHVHSLYRQTVDAAGLGHLLAGAEVPEQELFGRLFPEAFTEAVLEQEFPEADVLIIDEAQDLLTPSNLDALDLMLRGGLAQGRWHLFHDPVQNLYHTEAEAVGARLDEVGFAQYELFGNCRNTRQVAVQTSILSGIDMAVEGAPSGPECNCIYFAGPTDFQEKLDANVRELLAADVRPRDMIVLSTRRWEHSMLAGSGSVAGLPLLELAAAGAQDENGKALLFSTIHGFKGLERQVVFAIDLDRLGDEQMAMLHYAGLSRACGYLLPFVEEHDRGRYAELARAFGLRLGGG